MTTWNNILSNYSFDSKFYNEHCDPADLCNPFVDVVPNYPIPAFRPKYNRFVDHSYNDVLVRILPSKDTLYDFPVSVYVTYLDMTSQGKQCIYFSNYHIFFFIFVQSFRFCPNAHAPCLAFEQN